jgi:hypothetical protein
MTFQVFIQIIIAILLAYIAWQNYRINKGGLRIQKDKLRLDLFDRRLKVFESCRQLISFIVTNGKPTREELYKFYVGSAEAGFLYGDEIDSYIEEMSNKGLRLIQVMEFLREKIYTSEEQKLKFIDESDVLFFWFTGQHKASRELFKKYLHFSIDKSS